MTKRAGVGALALGATLLLGSCGASPPPAAHPAATTTPAEAALTAWTGDYTDLGAIAANQVRHPDLPLYLSGQPLRLARRYISEAHARYGPSSGSLVLTSGTIIRVSTTQPKVAGCFVIGTGASHGSQVLEVVSTMRRAPKAAILPRGSFGWVVAATTTQRVVPGAKSHAWCSFGWLRPEYAG
ncbi:MAG: hypothetical protein ACYDH5_10135 [Acidimicrobiales bacterium]